MKQDLLGLKELKVEVLKSKHNNKPVVRIAQIETNEQRNNRGTPKPPVVSRYRLKDNTYGYGESFQSSEIEGTVVFGPPSEDFPFHIVVLNTDVKEDGVFEVTLGLEPVAR